MYLGNVIMNLLYSLFFYTLVAKLVEIPTYARQEPVYPTVNFLAVDDLSTQGAKAVTAMLFTHLSRVYI